MDKDKKQEVRECCLKIIDELEVVVDYFDSVGYEGFKYEAILCAAGALHFLARELNSD